MKRILLLLIALFSVFSAVGCISKNEIHIPQVEKTISNTDKALTKEKQKNEVSNDNNVEPEIDIKNKVNKDVGDIAEFIPKGWDVLKKYDELAIVEGDLNKDGIMDKAFVIEQSNSSENAPSRNLLIVFGNKDNTYTQSIKAEKAILLANEGGPFGDPFQDIIIDRGSVLLKFFGGSSRWHRYFRFRYQDNGWYLIGFTEGSYESIGDSMDCLEDDYNLITGDYIGEKLVDGKIKTIKKNIGKKQLLNLTNFVANEYHIQPDPMVVSPNSNATKEVLKVPTGVDSTKIADLPKFPDTIKDKNEIIPDGWNMLDMLENDFNNDGLVDIVGVVEYPNVEGEKYPRTIFVYLNNGNGYSKNLVNQYLIRNMDEGGIFGDPYEKLTARNNTFTTHTYGGSAWKWTENYTFEYKNDKWFSLYEENIYGYGSFETSYSFNDYKLGIGKRRYTEASPEKENPSKLEFAVKLDKQPLLTDFVYNNWWGTERLKAPVIKSFNYNEGIAHFVGDISPLDNANILFQNKGYIIYKIIQGDGVVFLGVFNYEKEHLQMIARYSNDNSNAINFSDHSCKLYKNRLYLQEDIVKMINIRKDGEVKKQSETVGVQLISMNLDGSDKKVVFKANNSKYKENEIIDGYLDYMTLIYELTGDEIIVEIFDGDVHPYYRMNLDGRNRKLIGSVLSAS